MATEELTPLGPLSAISRDIRQSAATLGEREARGLVDLYYTMQDYRKATHNQERALDEAEEPHATTTHFGTQFMVLERQVKSALDVYSAAQPLGQWARDNIGIGPVIAAGLLAHIDIAQAPTVGHIWRFAGLDPTSKWEKGQKRPWNAKLKVLCWKIGDSFCKTSNNEKSFYGPLYKQRKQYEVARDEAVMEAQRHHIEFGGDGGVLGDTLAVGIVTLDGDTYRVYELAEGKFFFGGNSRSCAETLARTKFTDKATRELYQSGHLPAGRLEQRARRWATKLFLAHYHEEGYRLLHNAPPPLPYPIAHLGHAHVITHPSHA